jgi:diguanylate cyclase (GGDEF)-like protein
MSFAHDPAYIMDPHVGGPPVPPGMDVSVAERAAVTTALLEATATLVAQTDPLALIRSMCEGLVAATPHIRLAWAWFGDLETTAITPMVAVGPASAYANVLAIERNFLTFRRPAFTALLAGEPEDAPVSRYSLFGPWRPEVNPHGCVVSVPFPLRVPDTRERGLLVFCADDEDYFDRVGREPFAAFARLAEVALAQANLRRQLHDQATHDALTALPNRALLRDELTKTHANAERYGRGYAIVMFDLDKFKSVNDRFGHDAGDRAIEAAARATRSALREGDMLGRWGGEEFLAIFPEADAEAAIAAADRMRLELDGVQLEVGSQTLPIRASFGVAVYPGSGTTMRDMLLAVDAAMYRAKIDGGNCIRSATG